MKCTVQFLCNNKMRNMPSLRSNCFREKRFEERPLRWDKENSHQNCPGISTFTSVICQSFFWVQKLFATSFDTEGKVFNPLVKGKDCGKSKEGGIRKGAAEKFVKEVLQGLRLSQCRTPGPWSDYWHAEEHQPRPGDPGVQGRGSCLEISAEPRPPGGEDRKTGKSEAGLLLRIAFHKLL